MRVIDRLYQYIEQKHIVPYNFERICGIANGYLKKQTKGKGSIGSEILDKIIQHHPDLSLNWLVSGKGPMIEKKEPLALKDSLIESDSRHYLTEERTLKMLRDKIDILENALADKEKIIRLMEAQSPKV